MPNYWEHAWLPDGLMEEGPRFQAASHGIRDTVAQGDLHAVLRYIPMCVYAFKS